MAPGCLCDASSRTSQGRRGRDGAPTDPTSFADTPTGFRDVLGEDSGPARVRSAQRLPRAARLGRQRPLFERLAFDSLDEARVSGYVIRWEDGAPRPLVVHGHGYGGDLEPMWRWAKAGLNVLGVEARGYGRSGDALPEPSPWGYVLTGIESPEEHVLRGAVCDYARAVEVGWEILGASAIAHGLARQELRWGTGRDGRVPTAGRGSPGRGGA
jgi:hypothetical protein